MSKRSSREQLEKIEKSLLGIAGVTIAGETSSSYNPNGGADSTLSKMKTLQNKITKAKQVINDNGVATSYPNKNDDNAFSEGPNFTLTDSKIQMLSIYVGRLHEEINQNIDSTAIRKMEVALEELEKVNGSQNKYYTKNQTEVTMSDYNGNKIENSRRLTLDELIEGKSEALPNLNAILKERKDKLREMIEKADHLTDEEKKELLKVENIEKLFFQGSDYDYQNLVGTWHEHNALFLKWVELIGDIGMSIAAFFPPIGTGIAAVYFGSKLGAAIFTGKHPITGERMDTLGYVMMAADLFGAIGAGVLGYMSKIGVNLGKNGLRQVLAFALSEGDWIISAGASFLFEEYGSFLSIMAMVLLGKAAGEAIGSYLHKKLREVDVTQLKGYGDDAFAYEDIFTGGKFKRIAKKLKDELGLTNLSIDDIRRFCEFYGTTFDEDGFLQFRLRPGIDADSLEGINFKEILGEISDYNFTYNADPVHYNNIIDTITDGLVDLTKPGVEDIIESILDDSMQPSDNIGTLYKPGELGNVDISWEEVMRQMRLDAMVSL